MIVLKKKVVRLPNGRFITVQMRESDPKEVDGANPDEVWTTGDGRKLLPKDMDLRHLLNVRKGIETRGEQAMKYYNVSVDEIDVPSFIGQLWPIYKVICEEVSRRITDGVEDPPRPVQLTLTERQKTKPQNERFRKFDFDL